MLLPDNETEDQGPEYEPGVPPLLGGLADGDDAQEEEYDAVHEGGQRLDAVLDGGVGLLGDVGKGVALMHEAAPDEAGARFN